MNSLAKARPNVRTNVRQNVLPTALCLALALSALLHASLPAAHDTWFEAMSRQQPGRLLMALGTGNQFPQLELPMDLRYLQRHGCQQDRQPVALQGLAMKAESLLLMAQTPFGPIAFFKPDVANSLNFQYQSSNLGAAVPLSD